MSRLERWTGQSVGIEHQEAKTTYLLRIAVIRLDCALGENPSLVLFICAKYVFYSLGISIAIPDS
ncbi:MAG TPA: hypothetical protein EYN06_07395 [Myxococcales bacterium]|nr:hypothetical protein [Myxococcales bacterium]